MSQWLIPRISTSDRQALTLDEGDIVYDVGENAIYVGDGSTEGGVLTTEADAVLYTTQSLTDAQKKIARENIFDLTQPAALDHPVDATDIISKVALEAQLVNIHANGITVSHTDYETASYSAIDLDNATSIQYDTFASSGKGYLTVVLPVTETQPDDRGPQRLLMWTGTASDGGAIGTYTSVNTTSTAYTIYIILEDVPSADITINIDGTDETFPAASLNNNYFSSNSIAPSSDSTTDDDEIADDALFDNLDSLIFHQVNDGDVVVSDGSGGYKINTAADVVEAGTDSTLSSSSTQPLENQAINTALNGKEDSLGDPSTDGQVLSSTTSGTRSWIDAGGGGSAADTTYDSAGTTLSSTDNVHDALDALADRSNTNQNSLALIIGDYPTINNATAGDQLQVNTGGTALELFTPVIDTDIDTGLTSTNAVENKAIAERFNRVDDDAGIWFESDWSVGHRVLWQGSIYILRNNAKTSSDTTEPQSDSDWIEELTEAEDVIANNSTRLNKIDANFHGDGSTTEVSVTGNINLASIFGGLIIIDVPEVLDDWVVGDYIGVANGSGQSEPTYRILISVINTTATETSIRGHIVDGASNLDTGATTYTLFTYDQEPNDNDIVVVNSNKEFSNVTLGSELSITNDVLNVSIAWNAATDYSVGDEVFYEGVLYVNIISGVSDDEPNDTTAAPLHWDTLAIDVSVLEDRISKFDGNYHADSEITEVEPGGQVAGNNIPASGLFRVSSNWFNQTHGLTSAEATTLAANFEVNQVIGLTRATNSGFTEQSDFAGTSATNSLFIFRINRIITRADNVGTNTQTVELRMSAVATGNFTNSNEEYTIYVFNTDEPSDGDLLSYDSANETWTNTALGTNLSITDGTLNASGGSGSANDVEITFKVNGTVLADSFTTNQSNAEEIDFGTISGTGTVTNVSSSTRIDRFTTETSTKRYVAQLYQLNDGTTETFQYNAVVRTFSDNNLEPYTAVSINSVSDFLDLETTPTDIEA